MAKKTVIFLLIAILGASRLFAVDAEYVKQQKLEADIAVRGEARPAGVDYLYSDPLDPAYIYLIQPGDVLNIRSIDGPEFHGQSINVRVSAKGTVKFPYIGDIFVAGLAEDQLAEKMEQALKKYFASPQIYVFVTRHAKEVIMLGKYDVFGEVRSPGKYQLTENLTVADAVLLAGGFTEYANQNAVRVVREVDGKRTSIRVRVGRIYKTGDRERDVLLQEGDVVIVPESWF